MGEPAFLLTAIEQPVFNMKKNDKTARIMEPLDFLTLLDKCAGNFANLKRFGGRGIVQRMEAEKDFSRGCIAPRLIIV